MLMAFGASDATYGYANTYFTVYLCGTVFNLLALGLNQFIICQGYARKGMISVMLGAALNIVLDPVFIFLFDMGVAGAAVATVLSQLASCLYVLRFLFGKSVPIAITFGGYDGRLMLRILAVGMTPFLIIGVDNIMIISMNAILQSYGGAELGDRLVTCATIAQSFMLVVTMPLGGISAGTGTILAYNYGARRRDRILKAQAFIAGLCVAYVTALFLLARLGGALFVRLFTTEPELAAEALSAIHICTLALIPLGLQYAIVDGFTGMGKVQLALPLSAFRKAVYFIALFALPAAFGARAAFYAEPISDIAGPVVSIAVYALCIRRILDFKPLGKNNLENIAVHNVFLCLPNDVHIGILARIGMYDGSSCFQGWLWCWVISANLLCQFFGSPESCCILGIQVAICVQVLNHNPVVFQVVISNQFFI